jgi:hypothetical protein
VSGRVAFAIIAAVRTAATSNRSLISPAEYQIRFGNEEGKWSNDAEQYRDVFRTGSGEKTRPGRDTIVSEAWTFAMVIDQDWPG